MFRDCDCGHTKDHHSTTREPHRCLHDNCKCKDYNPSGVKRVPHTEMPNIKEIEDKFKSEKETEYGKTVWYVIEKPNSVIATCYTKQDAERISNLLNFAEKTKILHEFEKKLLQPLIITLETNGCVEK